MKKNILVVCYGGGHVAMMLPVIKEIQKNTSCSLTILALTTAGAVMETENISYVGYKDFTHLVDASFSDIGKLLVGPESASTTISHDESVAYHGINYLDLVTEYGEQEASRRYQETGRQCFNPINFMTGLLTELNIDLLISTNSPRSERAAINAAGLLDIKSLCLVDLFALQEVEWLGQQSYASKLCVLNPSVKDMLINVGRMDNEVEVTGNPAFDSLTSPNTIAKGLSIKTERGWQQDEIITLLYASQPEPIKHPFSDLSGDPALPRNIENSLREFVSVNTNYRLVVRYHPSENVIFIPQERVEFSPREESLHGLLHAVDIVIVTASTVGLEAHLIGKPIITVDNSIFTADAPYSAMGISHGIENIEMLSSTIVDVEAKLQRELVSREKLNATANVMTVVNRLLS